MSSNAEEKSVRPYWFVGAAFSGTDDQTQRFISQGIWKNGYKDKYLKHVLDMKPGDRIAIKSTYTREHGLKFDTRGQSISCMRIKAIGTITENLGDGQEVRVDWTSLLDELREWYFYIHLHTVWRVTPGKWEADSLIDFAFHNKPQPNELIQQRTSSRG
jgi:5-methylcytosine-specific restriction protein B